MRPSLQTRFTFFMYRFHPSAYSPFRNPQSVSNFLVCPTCTFEFQRSIPTSLFPIWNANLSCAHDCILSCSPGDPINAALYNGDEDKISTKDLYINLHVNDPVVPSLGTGLNSETKRP